MQARTGPPSPAEHAAWPVDVAHASSWPEDGEVSFSSDPTPSSPIQNMPPAPPPIKPESTAFNKPPHPIKRPSLRRGNPRISHLEQIRNPGIRLRPVKRSNLTEDKKNTGTPSLSNALLGAMNKIRMATRDSDLYGVIEDEKIYQERNDDW